MISGHGHCKKNWCFIFPEWKRVWIFWILLTKEGETTGAKRAAIVHR